MKRKLIFTFWVILFFMLIFNTNSFAHFEIDSFVINANITVDGDMHVTEVINYNTNEVVNGLTRNIKLENNKNTKNSADSLELLGVSVDGKICDEIPVNSGSKGDRFVYEYEKSKKNYDIKLYTPFETESKTVVYEYMLRNVAVKYNDIAEIYWNFIGDEWDCDINNLIINITLPVNAALEKSYVFGHGSDNGSFTKSGTEINLYAQDIEAFQPIDARILFARDAISNSNKVVNKNVLEKYINEEEGMSSEMEDVNIIGNFSITNIAIGFVALVVISAVIVYLKYDKEERVEKVRYYREMPFGLEPELLQYFYYGKTVSNSYYVAFLNLIKLGVYRLENSINKVGKEVQKIVYNENHNAKLKEYQSKMVKTINKYLIWDENTERSIDLLTLNSRMSNSSGYGFSDFESSLKAEKESLVGKSKKAPSKIKFIPISILIALMITILFIGIKTSNEMGITIPFMMGFLTLIYSVFFINVGNSLYTMLFLICHCGCFQGALIGMMITSELGILYIPYILIFIYIIYVYRIEKFPKEERQIIEYIKGLKRYIKHYSMLSSKDELDYINLWEDYFIMAIALKLNNKIINYFYDYGREQVSSSLGNSMHNTNTYNDFNNNMQNTFENYHKSSMTHGNTSSRSSYSGSSGGFSGGSSSGGGGGRRWWRKQILNSLV